MFHAISSVMRNTLAPDRPPVVDFRHQWNMFLRFYAENKPLHHKSQPVEKTYLVYHLNNMLKMLIKEQEEINDDETIGPCLEYIIHHQVLDILSSLCQADVPPGIRPYIFKLFTFLVSKIRQPIIAYINVYYPIRRLLMLSTMVKASPTENQELTFITCLITKLKHNPEFLSLFAHDAKPGDISHSSSRRSSAMSSMIDLTHIEEITLPGKSLLQDFEKSHLVIAALINLIDSADYMIAIKAMDALLIVTAIPDNHAAQNAVVGTTFISVITDRLQKLFDEVPTDVEVPLIEEVKATWMEAHHLLKEDDTKISDFHGRTELVNLFSWLDFCDDLVRTSAETISEALAEAIREQYFEERLQTRLMNAKESRDKVRILALTTQSWVHLRSQGLANEFSQWMFGDNSNSDTNGVVSHEFKHFLIQLCHCEDSDVSLECLSLFDVILERPCDPILSSLVINNLSQRGFYNSALAESNIASWSEEEDEREKTQRQMGLNELTPKTRRSKQKSPSPSILASRTMAPSNIARVINAWLYLVPDTLRSSDTAKESGYEQYVKNAQVQVGHMFKKCEGFSWPRESIFPERSDSSNSDSAHVSDSLSSDSRVEADPTRTFYEGDFLSVLFDMIETLLDRNYDVNLQLTSILSKLAQIPHPHLHEFLLNPTIPIVSGVRTLYLSMQKVLEKIKDNSKDIDQLQRKVYMCRKTILSSDGDRLALNLTKNETQVIDALIVLEEFSKEIAAITLVKYHLAS